MNRRERRKLGIYADVASRVICMDCDSVVEVEKEVAPNVSNIVVRHDESCPWLAAYRAAGGTGVRFVARDDEPDDAA